MAAPTELEPVDLKRYAFDPPCDVCRAALATHIGQGCGDDRPVLMCDSCLDRGLEVIAMYVRTWMRHNKRVMVCGHCYRPMIHLETHLDVRVLPRPAA